MSTNNSNNNNNNNNNNNEKEESEPIKVSLNKPGISTLKEHGNYGMCIDGMMVMDGQTQKRLNK